MATVNYYLKGSLSDENINTLAETTEGQEYIKSYSNTPLQIVLKVSYRGKRLQVYTKRRIAPIYWDKEKQEYNPKKFRKNCTENNKWLHDLKDEVASLADLKERNGSRITQNELREVVIRRISNKPSKKTLAEVFDIFLSKHTTQQGNSLKPLTIKKYVGFFNHLKKFLEEYKSQLNFELFDQNFIHSFKHYLHSEQGLSDATVLKNIKTYKVFIKYLAKLQFINDLDFSEVKATSKPGEIYVIHIEKVIELQNKKIKHLRLAQVRDVFCFMCWTGQRYSDIENLTWQDINKNENEEIVWDLTTVKTQTRIQVPIIDYAYEIIQKYNDSEKPLPQYSNQKINEYRKELGQYMKWDWIVKKIHYYDGRPKEKAVPFYEVLTTHVGRKSFITNSLILGIPERIVKEISGHKDDKSFSRYVKLAENYKSQIIREKFSKSNVEKENYSPPLDNEIQIYV